jgi:hypothetical protein
MSAHRRVFSFFTLCTSVALGLITACAAGQGGNEELAPCFVDGDCGSGLVCSGGACVPEGSDAAEEDTDDDWPDTSVSGGDTADDSGSDTDAEDPDDPDPTGNTEPLDTDGGDTDGGVCIEEEQPCEASSECCGYSETPANGSGVCIVGPPDDEPSCTSWCETHEDCASTCCAGVADSELGACIPGSVCRAYDRCLDGVVLFCQCGVLAESECTDEEIDAYVQECAALEGGTYEIFDCLGGHYTGTTDANELLDICVDGLEMCNPS